MKKYYFMIAALATAMAGFTSCSNDDETPQFSQNEIRLSASMDVTGVQTRAAGNYKGSQFTTAAEYQTIGIYAWETTKTAATATYDGYENITVSSAAQPSGSSNWELTPAKKLYFPINNGDVDVYLYAPRVSSPTVDNTMKMSFSVQPDQSTNANYLASDFIFGKGTAVYSTTDKLAEVTMYHALSKIIIILNPSDGISTTGLQEIKLTGVKPDTKIYMSETVVPATGLVAGASGASGIHVENGSGTATDVYLSKGTGDSNETQALSANGVAAIIPPQALSGLSIAVKIDGKTATKALSSGLSYGTSSTVTSFDPGKKYTITLNLKGPEITVQVVSIEDWGAGNGSGSSLDLDTWS